MRNVLRELLEMNTQLRNVHGISLAVTIEDGHCHVIASTSLNYMPRTEHFTAEVDDQEDMEALIEDVRAFRDQLIGEVYDDSLAKTVSLLETLDRRFLAYLATDTGMQLLKERITMRLETLSVRG